MPTLKIVTLEAKYAPALEELQRLCYPTLHYNDLMRAEHFLKHCEIFPEGEFVALLDDVVVGLGSGFFTNFDFDHPNHRFREMVANGYYTNHDPNGDWYYGADISVHPQYRGRGIGQRLYDARKALVQRYNRRGIVAGGLIPDFVRHKDSLSPQAYVDKVIAGQLFDSTLSFQLKNGFVVRGMLEGYIEDSASDHWSTLIVWENPDYRAE